MTDVTIADLGDPWVHPIESYIGEFGKLGNTIIATKFMEIL